MQCQDHSYILFKKRTAFVRFFEIDNELTTSTDREEKGLTDLPYRLRLAFILVALVESTAFFLLCTSCISIRHYYSRLATQHRLDTQRYSHAHHRADESAVWHKRRFGHYESHERPMTQALRLLVESWIPRCLRTTIVAGKTCLRCCCLGRCRHHNPSSCFLMSAFTPSVVLLRIQKQGAFHAQYRVDGTDGRQSR